MNAAEEERAERLLPIISDCLRFEAKKVGKNLDEMIKMPAVYVHYKKYKWVKDLTVKE